jgi:hypothetical protein
VADAGDLPGRLGTALASYAPARVMYCSFFAVARTSCSKILKRRR